MGTEKHLQFGVFFVDTVLLIAFVFGFYYLMCYLAPESVENIREGNV